MSDGVIVAAAARFGAVDNPPVNSNAPTAVATEPAVMNVRLDTEGIFGTLAPECSESVEDPDRDATEPPAHPDVAEFPRGRSVGLIPKSLVAASPQPWVIHLGGRGHRACSSWEPPVEQSAQLVLHCGNPYAGGADPLAATPGDSSLARQVSSNSTKFAVSTDPNAQQAGTYTAQFYNGGKSFGATTAELTYQTSVGTVCPASPLTGHVVN